ncbi:ABC transporter ATP-binding protein/permease [Patescibacteria group bacterium]|nr:ABC transporter ATP-binding protein/permease [Patescibacteria group bacterium]
MLRINLENWWPTLAQEKLLALPVGYHERENTGRKIAKVSRGVERLINMLGEMFWGLLPALVYLAANTAIVLAFDWRLGLIFALPIAVAIWINLKSCEVYLPQWGKLERVTEESVGLFCQSIINVRTVQAFVAEKREEARHAQIREGLRERSTTIALHMQRWFFGMELLIGLSLALTIVTGLYFVYVGWSSLGTVAYIAIAGSGTIQCLWQIIHVYNRMMHNLVAAERLHTLLNEPVGVANLAQGVEPQIQTGALAFEQVMLRYAGKTEPVFDQFDLSIEPGEMLALVGKSGSGKSSLVSLLLRSYDPTEGAVTVDGTDIRAVDRDWYRRRFAYVPQDVEIFDGTIRENIVYAAPEASEASVARAIEAACLEEVVRDAKRFPDGLATEVGERGVRLSGGERQRVGIARAYIALLAGAEVLVLDEATSSLDSESERVVQRFIEELRRDRHITIVAIAHRLSTIREADRICVLDHGAIAEIGTHEQLLRQNGLYHRLVALQKLGELRE